MCHACSQLVACSLKFFLFKKYNMSRGSQNYSWLTQRFFIFFFSVKTACESRENDLQGLLSLADSTANSIEKLVLDGGKIPEVSSMSSAVLVVTQRFC